jgi:hypothetical protein
MGASTIFFNGKLISVPGSYSEVDASGLEAVGLGASGIVALLGTSVGGKPYSAIGSDVPSDLQIATRPAQPFKFFRSGDLREAAPLVFGPSTDPDIPSGAQAIIFVKVNPAAAASAVFNNPDGPALGLAAKDYGYFTNQIAAEIGDSSDHIAADLVVPGSGRGQMITLTFEDIEEVFDNVGGETVFTLKYLASAPSNGFTTITVAVTASAIVAAFTRAALGLDTDVTNPVTPGQVIELVSSNAGDTAIVVEIYGTNAANATQRQQVTLNGITPVDTAGLWNAFHGARIVSGTALGTITLRNDGAGTTVTTLTAGAPTKGLRPCVDMTVAGTAISYVADAASTNKVTAYGLSSTGTVQTEVVTLNGTTPVPGTALWKRLDYLALGGLAVARTLTIAGNAANAPFSGFSTIQKMADKFNATPGFTLAPVTNRPSTFLASDLDIVTATNILSPANPSFYADLMAVVTKLNAESSLVVATRGTPGTGAPSNTTAVVFLTGGHEGSTTPGQEANPTATFADWQAGLDLLTKVFKNSVVVLTGDAAVHAAVDAHCAYMGGIGRQECDAFVGLMNSTLTDVVEKSNTNPLTPGIKQQIINLGSRHIRALAQTVQRYDTLGELREFMPPFGAAILAGMQAGSPVGTSLTHKYANVIKLRQHSGWNPVDDAEEMIQAGLCFMETVDGIGRRVVRNVTTHLSTSNIAYTEGSVNEAVNYAVYNFRTQMERVVGKRGFVGTVNGAKAIAINTLGLLVGVALVTWRNLSIDLILDVLEVACEIAPVLPINFVKSTIHLVSVPQSAAAA